MSNPIFRVFARWLPLLAFQDSQSYWRTRYKLGGDSGAGSAGDAADYKARVLNKFVADFNVASVGEFGCGDGRQLAKAKYPDYLGVDISSDAIRQCQERFHSDSSKRFVVLNEYTHDRVDLALSLDVIFHLVEDVVYNDYLNRLFAAATRFVVIYSSDEVASAGTLRHVRHRNVSADVVERYPEFDRMSDYEAELPPPVEFNRGVPTRFLFYRRVGN